MIFKKKQSDDATILKALKAVRLPSMSIDIVSAGMIESVRMLNDGHVVVALKVAPEDGPAMEGMRQEAESVLRALPGVKKVTAVLTAQAPARTSLAAKLPDPHGMEKNPRLDLPIKKIIVVSSGKGGVGKSTIAANIAFSLSLNSQLKIGLLDADIYGPSIPRMMNLEGRKLEFTAEKKMVPLNVQAGAYGLKVMSIGFMVDAGKALIWRGPMVQSAIYQLFRDVEWGTDVEPLDILVVDMPPGTGDAQLTIAQKIPVSGAVVVSTPQDIALIDARKGIEMFQKTGVPILGIVENMSTHVCSNCGHEEHIFGHGGAKAEAEKLGVPFLGEIPLSLHIRKSGDAGEPVGGVFDDIADTIQRKLF